MPLSTKDLEQIKAKFETQIHETEGYEPHTRLCRRENDTDFLELEVVPANQDHGYEFSAIHTGESPDDVRLLFDMMETLSIAGEVALSKVVEDNDE